MNLKKRRIGTRVISFAMAFAIGASLAFTTPAASTVRADETKETTDQNQNQQNQNNGRKTKGDEIVAMARSYIGKVDYVYAGKNLETGVDCSGFVCAIFEKFGINLWPYRNDSESETNGWMFYSYKQFGTYVGKDPKLAQAGDLIITTDHVAIATGDGNAVSALNPGVGVQEHSLLSPWASSYFGGYDAGGGWIIVRPYGVSSNNVFYDPENGVLLGVDYSPVYDYKYYREHHPDVVAVLGLPSANNSKEENAKLAEQYLTHFINYGMREGRQASEKFNVTAYRRNYEDLRKAFGTSQKQYYLHYLKYGIREQRNAVKVLNPVTVYNGVDYSAVYDFRYYQEMNPDIKAYFGEEDEQTLKHFVTRGMKEGRIAKKTFDVQSYMYNYRDLRRAFGSNTESYYKHYMKYGVREKRVATGVTQLNDYETVYTGKYGPHLDYSLVYDYNYYINRYPDIKRAFGNDDKAVLEHFVKNGMREGRIAKESFNIVFYKNSGRNGDLRAAFGNDNRQYYIHYIKYGYREKRKASK